VQIPQRFDRPADEEDVGNPALVIADRPCSRAGKYMTFLLAGHYYAVEASHVRAVLPAQGVSAGAIALGGRAVRVIDIRDKLGARGPATCSSQWVLVLDLLGRSIGIEVERIGEISNVRDRDFRDGVIQLRLHGRPYGRAKTVIDPDALFTAADLDQLLGMRTV
jgi:chemotaxis signal transduction protein